MVECLPDLQNAKGSNPLSVTKIFKIWLLNSMVECECYILNTKVRFFQELPRFDVNHHRLYDKIFIIKAYDGRRLIKFEFSNSGILNETYWEFQENF